MKNSSTRIDNLINGYNPKRVILSVIEVDFSDHSAQIVTIPVESCLPKITKKPHAFYH